MRIYIPLLLFYLCFSFSISYGQPLLINEFEAKNASTLKDNYGEYDDWIEIANISNQSINLNNYYITDDLAEITKHKLTAISSELTIPAGGFLILWADKDLTQGSKHVDFKLGDTSLIALFSPALNMIDSVSYKKQYTDISMGRDINNSSSWKFYATPSPGKANNTDGFAGVLEPPVFSPTSGFYSSKIDVGLAAEAGNSVFYTLDSSDPKSNSLQYTDSIPLSKTQVIRAISQKSGWINSGIESQIYFENVNTTLPVLAIMTDSLNLFDPQKGIYINYNETGPDWERFCQIKYFVDGEIKAASNAGLRIQGASSLYMSKKSFRLFFKDVYGTGNLKYPIFGEENLSTFNKLVLKSGYDDDITFESSKIGTLLRDALSVALWNRAGGIPQLSSWCTLYLNNRYWGIYNIRESIDENYIEAHTGQKNFDLIRLQNEGPELKFGSMTRWNELFNLIKTSDFSVNENYQKVAEMMDMDNFITLMAFVQCTQYYSWPWGISMYRDYTATGKWMVSIWDTDRAYYNNNYSNYKWDGFDEAQKRTDTYYWGNIFPKQLIKNAEFKQKYSNRINELLGTVFKPENVLPVLDSLYLIIKPEMPGELNRWNPSNNDWENNVENLREFLRRRPAFLLTQMKRYLPPATTDVNAENINPGYLQAYPNPFINQTNVRFYLEKDNNVDISIFDLEGRLVNNLIHKDISNGEHNVVWNGNQPDGSPVQPGIYLIRFRTNEKIEYLKIIKVE